MQGEGQYWREGVLVLMSPDTVGRAFTIPGWSLVGDRTESRESRMVAVAVSFVTVDQCLRVSQSKDRLASWRVGLGVQPLQSVKLYI